VPGKERQAEFVCYTSCLTAEHMYLLASQPSILTGKKKCAQLWVVTAND